MPIIDLNINQMMCYRCNKVWLPRLTEEAPNFFTGKTLELSALYVHFGLFLLTSSMLK